MNITKIADNTHQLLENLNGVLFEGLWEIPNGTSVNSYVIKGDKTAVIDGFGNWNGEADELRGLLGEIDVKPEDIDYLIINHMEPDHSGWLEEFTKLNKDFKIICSFASAQLLKSFYNYDENIITVKDDFVLDLGQDHVLAFRTIPNIHWPDTIATLDTKTGILFSCDAFGSFGEVGESVFDDTLTEEQIEFYEYEAVRYYSNIVASFSSFVTRGIKKLEDLEINMIAPGHGIIWRENPNKIIEDYERYVSYQKGTAKEEITVIWGSMYGMTQKAVDVVIETLEKENIKYNVHRVPETSWGQILTSAWNSTGVILAMPTYEFNMFPPMAAAITELGKKKVQGRKAFRLGSFGWSGGAQKELDEILDKHRMNWDFIEPVEFKGNATQGELESIKDGVHKLVQEVRTTVNK